MRLPGGVVKQRLRDTGGLELVRQISIGFLARETFQVILHGDALAQWFVLEVRNRSLRLFGSSAAVLVLRERHWGIESE